MIAVCPSCRSTLQVQDTLAGAESNCPVRAALFTTPKADADVQSKAPEKNNPSAAGGIRFSCTSCGQVNSMPNAAVGTKVACPKCGQKLIVPSPPATKPNAQNKTTLGKLEEGDPHAGPVTGIPSQPKTPVKPPPFVLPLPDAKKHDQEKEQDRGGAGKNTVWNVARSFGRRR
jgi:predicted RNA-binding Zn-ribbon protein involved in translation (DUF1610 family)